MIFISSGSTQRMIIFIVSSQTKYIIRLIQFPIYRKYILHNLIFNLTEQLFCTKGNPTTWSMYLVMLEVHLLPLQFLFNLFLIQLLIKASSWAFLCSFIKSKSKILNFSIRRTKSIRTELMNLNFKLTKLILLCMIFLWWSFQWYFAASIGTAYVFVGESGRNIKKF